MKSPTVATCFAIFAALHLTGCGSDPSGPVTFVPFIVFDSDRTSPTTVWKMNLNGSNPVQLVSEESYWGTTDNSGTLLAYIDAASQLKLKNLSTGAVTPLATSSSPSTRGTLNRSGTRIVFTSERDGGDREIWIINTNGTGLTRLTNHVGDDVSPAFSPDGQKIVFVRSEGAAYDVWVMNVDGSGLTNLSNNASEDLHPTFSPDGSKIVFSSNRLGGYDLFTMNADGSNQTRLLQRDGNDNNAAYTPNGQQVVFWGSPPQPGPAQIFIVNVDGTGLLNLSNSSIHETRLGGIIPSGTQ